MGAQQKIDELEALVKSAQTDRDSNWRLCVEMKGFIDNIARLPITAICYVEYGQSIVSNPRDAAKVFLGRLKKVEDEQPHV